jgi:hypothetical protein
LVDIWIWNKNLKFDFEKDLFNHQEYDDFNFAKCLMSLNYLNELDKKKWLTMDKENYYKMFEEKRSNPLEREGCRVLED